MKWGDPLRLVGTGCGPDLGKGSDPEAEVLEALFLEMDQKLDEDEIHRGIRHLFF